MVFALLAGAVRAAPPQHGGCVRMDELRSELEARYERARAREEFEAKPLPERLVLLLKKGARTYAGEAVTGPRVVKAVLQWDALGKSPRPSPAARVVADLPDALKARYLKAGADRALHRERYDTGRMLADALTSDAPWVREVAADALNAVFGRTLGYDPAGPETDRKRKQREWTRELRRYWR